MEMKELTQEQKDKLKKLKKQYSIRGAGRAVKFILSLFLANAIVIILDVTYVHSQAFVFLGGMTSMIMLFSALRSSLAVEHDRIKEEVKKILES